MSHLAWDCPETVYGQHDEGRDGCCIYCRRRIGAPTPRPTHFLGGTTELDLAYDQVYDPDYGGRRRGDE